jgi:hypothetical protein
MQPVGGWSSERNLRPSGFGRAPKKVINPMVYIGIGGGALLLLVIIGVAVSSSGGTRTGTGSSSGPVAHDGTGGALLAQGQELLAKAQRMPAGPSRNAVYKEAASIFSSAQQKLNAAGQSQLAIEANRGRYASLKGITE